MIALAPSVALAQSNPTTSPTTTDSTQAAGSLGPGDLVVVKIWREPDLSDTLQVDNAGVAVFPKLGPIEVVGMRPDSLERMLVRQYGQYLQNPSIRVAVLRRITVWGAVVRPGLYPVDLTMTITDALALAGGVTPDGRANKVELRRGSERKVIDLSGSSGKTRVGNTSLRSGDQLFVPQRSWVSRNVSLVIGSLATVVSLAYLITSR